MASSKVITSTNSRNSDLKRLSTPSSSTKPSFMISDRIPKTEDCDQNQLASSSAAGMTVDGLLQNVFEENSGVAVGEDVLLDAEISLIDAAGAISAVSDCDGNNGESSIGRQTNYGSAGVVRKTVDEVWREIVAGKSERKGCKVEAPDEMMTLEDFLAKAGAVDEEDVKGSVSAGPITERLSGGMSGTMFGFDQIGQVVPYVAPTMVEGGVMGYVNGAEGMVGVGRGKRRAGSVLEPLDKAAQQRQRRMIKNRESAARSRERKQAHQVELEALAAKLEEENEQLLKEKEERTKERFKQLMEKVVPVVEMKRPARALKRVRSMQW